MCVLVPRDNLGHDRVRILHRGIRVVSVQCYVIEFGIDVNNKLAELEFSKMKHEWFNIAGWSQQLGRLLPSVLGL